MSSKADIQSTHDICMHIRVFFNPTGSKRKIVIVTCMIQDSPSKKYFHQCNTDSNKMGEFGNVTINVEENRIFGKHKLKK